MCVWRGGGSNSGPCPIPSIDSAWMLVLLSRSLHGVRMGVGKISLTKKIQATILISGFKSVSMPHAQSFDVKDSSEKRDKHICFQF